MGVKQFLNETTYYFLTFVFSQGIVYEKLYLYFTIVVGKKKKILWKYKDAYLK